MKPGTGDWIRCEAVAIRKIGIGLCIDGQTTFDQSVRNTCFDVLRRNGRATVGCVVYPEQVGWNGAKLSAVTPTGRILALGKGAWVRRASPEAVAFCARRAHAKRP